MRNQLLARSASLVLAAASAFAGADLPYIGKWKLNPAKSNLTGSTITYSLTKDEYTYTEQGQSYKFKADGRNYVTPFGYTASWKGIDDHAAEMTAKLNGKTIQTDSLKLSADGQTMTVTSKGSNPKGQPWEDVTVYRRVTGGKALAGTWKAIQVKMGSLRQIEFTPFGDDGVTWSIADYNVKSNAKFDGKDYPAQGPSAPGGLTVSLEKTGSLSFQLTEKKDGKPVYKAAYSVSTDGKTLTEVGSSGAVEEKTTFVYDRQ
jgi:hypothetical protein